MVLNAPSISARIALLAILAGACVGSASARGDDEWKDRVEHGPFVVRSETSIGDREKLIQELLQLRNDIEATLKIKTVSDTDGPRIQLNLFKSHRSYARHLAERVPAAASRPACFIQGPDLGRVYVVRGDDALTDVRHEMTHALLHQALEFVPLWLDEGLAVYFEAPRETRVKRPPYLAGLRWQCRFGWKPDLNDLESREDLAEMRSADYRQSWAWVHFLLHDSKESRSTLLNYLSEIQAGLPPGPLSLVLRDEISDADARLVKHLETWK